MVTFNSLQRTVYYINIEKDKPKSGLKSKFCGKFAKNENFITIFKFF